MLLKNLLLILKTPANVFTLLALFLFILFLLHLKKIKITTTMLVYIGLMLALSFLLHQIRFFHMPQGGSITCGGMIPLLLITYRYGMEIGALTGFLYGLLNLLLDPFMLHPLQVIFDFPLPYMVLSLAALWKHHRFLSTALAFSARFLCHFISGIVFFDSYAPAGSNILLYSLSFNASYLLPEYIITFILLKIMPLNRLINAMDKTNLRRF